MIRSKDHALDLIAKRKSLGKKGIPKAVRRYCKRTGDNFLVTESGTIAHLIDVGGKFEGTKQPIPVI